MIDVSPREKGYRVICVCAGEGFPLGTGSSARIAMIGRALSVAGIGFHLLHCGSSPVAINTQRAGIYEGVSFEYTTTVKRPKNRLVRLLTYTWAIVVLTARLVRLRPVRHHTLVYLYAMMGPINLYTGIVCRILGLPVVQEFCEWFPGEPACSSFTKWLHKGSMFKLATGALVISRMIEERVRQCCSAANPDLLIHRVPAIVDARMFAGATPMRECAAESVPTFVYCGTWSKDIPFLIDALVHVKQSGYQCRLTIVGIDQSGPIQAYAAGKGLSREDIVVAGSVDRRSLASFYYKAAAALLLPLWSDDRSVTRFPNKISEYLASGRPVISCRIGELAHILTDQANAYLGEPGNERDFADRMISVLRDPDRANQIGAAGQRTCFDHLDYRAHVSGLAKFFLACIAHHRERHFATEKMQYVSNLHSKLRNFFCAMVALGLIASGRVRREKKRALSTGVITAIYFHKPNRQLFARCIKWLTRSGYTFIDANELIEILHDRKTGPRGAVWLSFDDGCKELLEDAIPLIHQLNVPVTLFIPSGIVEGDGRFPWMLSKKSSIVYEARANYTANNGVRDAMTISEVKQLANLPQVTIGSHTVHHAVTTNLSEDRIRFELGESRRALELWTPAQVKSFAYPEGQYDGRESMFLLEIGYRLAATTENGFITAETNPYRVPRFSVADEITFPEAICNMVGVWRPTIDPLIHFLQRVKKSQASKTHYAASFRPSRRRET
jgi:glycosyltransferase involved in cell wall biosynthesis/peptidoglycan/xylan/chitin deacetylase (PgdA/CDA1 family)